MITSTKFEKQLEAQCRKARALIDQYAEAHPELTPPDLEIEPEHDWGQRCTCSRDSDGKAYWFDYKLSDHEEEVFTRDLFGLFLKPVGDPVWALVGVAAATYIHVGLGVGAALAVIGYLIYRFVPITQLREELLNAAQEKTTDDYIDELRWIKRHNPQRLTEIQNFGRGGSDSDESAAPRKKWWN